METPFCGRKHCTNLMERNILLFFTFKANFVCCCCCCCLHIHIEYAACLLVCSQFVYVLSHILCIFLILALLLFALTTPRVFVRLLDLISRQSHDLLLLLGRYYEYIEKIAQSFSFLVVVVVVAFVRLPLFLRSVSIEEKKTLTKETLLSM